MIITWVHRHHGPPQGGGQTHVQEDEPLQAHGSLLGQKVKHT